MVKLGRLGLSGLRHFAWWVEVSSGRGNLGGYCTGQSTFRLSGDSHRIKGPLYVHIHSHLDR